MTLYLASYALRLGKLRFHDYARISEKASAMEGSRMFVACHAQVQIKDLIQGIVVQSGNDASVALAEHLAGSEEAYVVLMNQKAE